MKYTTSTTVVHPQLSFEIIGCAFEVFNTLGFGLAEKDYQKALALALKKKNLNFREQAYFPLKFAGQTIRKQFVDFVVEEQVIVELKKTDRFSFANIDQVNQYLKTSNLKLGILINISPQGVKYKRLVNL